MCTNEGGVHADVSLAAPERAVGDVARAVPHRVVVRLVQARGRASGHARAAELYCATPPLYRRSVKGTYNTVTCLDVMIHYPQDKVDAMISHLAGLSDQRLIISFAPNTLSYSILKRIGELFPGPSKVRRAGAATAPACTAPRRTRAGAAQCAAPLRCTCRAALVGTPLAAQQHMLRCRARAAPATLTCR